MKTILTMFPILVAIAICIAIIACKDPACDSDSEEFACISGNVKQCNADGEWITAVPCKSWNMSCCEHSDTDADCEELDSGVCE